MNIFAAIYFHGLKNWPMQELWETYYQSYWKATDSIEFEPTHEKTNNVVIEQV